MNCWFRRIEYKNLKDLSNQLNKICAERGIQDVSIVDTHCNIGEEIIHHALVKISSIQPLGQKIDGGSECKVTT